jgi:DNA-damage-inducible protein D
VVTNCHQLKMIAEDGKMRFTDVADLETIFRLIQSIPSPKAEPIKMWLAKVGNERINEISDPEQSLNRARQNWQKHGRSEKWIQQRMMGQETRNKLTDYWRENDVKQDNEFAILTNIIHQEWSNLTVTNHKKLKPRSVIRITPLSLLTLDSSSLVLRFSFLSVWHDTRVGTVLARGY